MNEEIKPVIVFEGTFKPSESERREELIEVLQQQEGYTKEMLKKDCEILGLCDRCMNGRRDYESRKRALCWECKFELND